MHVAVDRVRLRLTGFSEAEGRRLALAIAEGLPTAGAARKTPLRLGRIESRVVATASEGVPRIADRIVTQLTRSIGGS